MKKLLLLLIFCLIAVPAKSATMNFSDAFEKTYTTPAAVVLYADWADNYNSVLQNFRQVQQSYGDIYNYAEINIANKEAKAYNDIYPINAKLPYVMLFRNKGSFSRYIDRACSANYNCLNDTMKSFLR